MTIKWYIRYYKIKLYNQIRIKNGKNCRHYFPNLKISRSTYPTSDWLTLNQREKFEIIGEQLLKNNTRLQ